jgi:glycosyltransferase involved in cell wall biosynthesis
MSVTVGVSVLVTVYNREAFLAETLESILGSTFDRWEAVVVDDCSTDGSMRIAEEFARRDSRFRVFRNDANLGDYANRNRAASLAAGKYLKYLDSDDLIYRHSLEVMVESMESSPDATLALAHSAPEAESPYPWRLSPEQAYRKEFLERGCLSCGPSGAIMRREAFDTVGGFRNEWGVISDIDLWLRLAARWCVVLLPPGLVWWRRHEGQEFTAGNAALEYLEKGFRLGLDALASPSCPLPSLDRDAARMRVRQHHARRLLALAMKSRQPRIAWRLFRASGLTWRELGRGFQRYR